MHRALIGKLVITSGFPSNQAIFFGEDYNSF